MLISALFVWVVGPAETNAATCNSLATLTLANTTITSARIVPAGGFVLPTDAPDTSVEFFSAFSRLPAYCRVQATITPSADSHIEVEVWLPASGWNGKYVGVGNGGYGGTFNYFRLGEALAGGYATSSTDTGHKGTSAESQWSIDHPEKQIDFDYRSIHETAGVAKAAIRAFYERAPERSYFNSCSNGGRQGLMEAERFPDDYDGIMAGAPSVHWGFGTFVSGQLDSFRDRGGKVMIYYGGNDAPQLALDYYKRLVTRMGQQTVDGFLQFYLVPGMGHCGSGPVPNDFGQYLRPQADAQHSMFKALERWVENGVAPESVIATQYKTDGDPTTGVLRTRPICPYPSEAEWTGAGNQNDAGNYACKVPLGK